MPRRLRAPSRSRSAPVSFSFFVFSSFPLREDGDSFLRRPARAHGFLFSRHTADAREQIARFLSKHCRSRANQVIERENENFAVAVDKSPKCTHYRYVLNAFSARSRRRGAARPIVIGDRYLPIPIIIPSQLLRAHCNPLLFKPAEKFRASAPADRPVEKGRKRKKRLEIKIERT